MSGKAKYLFLFTLMLLMFSYGVVVGRYQLFPYEELKNVQDLIFGYGFVANPGEGKARLETVVDTALTEKEISLTLRSPLVKRKLLTKMVIAPKNLVTLDLKSENDK